MNKKCHILKSFIFKVVHYFSFNFFLINKRYGAHRFLHSPFINTFIFILVTKLPGINQFAAPTMGISPGMSPFPKTPEISPSSRISPTEISTFLVVVLVKPRIFQIFPSGISVQLGLVTW